MYKSDLRNISEGFTDIRNVLKDGKMDLDAVKSCMERMEVVSQNLTILKNNLPKHLPCNDSLQQQCQSFEQPLASEIKNKPLVNEIKNKPLVNGFHKEEMQVSRKFAAM